MLKRIWVMLAWTKMARQELSSNWRSVMGLVMARVLPISGLAEVRMKIRTLMNINAQTGVGSYWLRTRAYYREAESQRQAFIDAAQLNHPPPDPLPWLPEHPISPNPPDMKSALWRLAPSSSAALQPSSSPWVS